MDIENLPIDIHCSKLLDWVISRRHSSADWPKKAYEIREKINHAIQDMPEHEKIVELLAGTYINYFHCQQIVEILKETEVDSKNIFGRYSSQRMKDWQEISKLYQNNSVYLAEASQILQRLGQYELPSLKRQISKCWSTRDECERKEQDYWKQSKDAKKQFQQECDKMGISGTKIRHELVHLAENLPEFFDQVASKCRHLRDAVDYYAKFRQYILRSAKLEENLLPLANFVLTNGNVTYFQWKYGKLPERIEPIQLEVSEVDDNAENEIDFGGLDDMKNQEEIDFDVIDSQEIDFADLGIETVQSGDFELVRESQQIDIPSVEENSKVARGEEAFSVLEHSSTQKLFIRDLREIEIFLKSRLLDLSTEHVADFLLASQRSRDDASYTGGDVSLIGVNEIRRMLSVTQEIIAAMTDTYKKHLFKIRSSPAYLQSLTEKLQQKGSQSAKYEGLANLMREKQTEMKLQAESLVPKLDLLVKRTKELQAQIEQDISKRYKNRPVNIMAVILN